MFRQNSRSSLRGFRGSLIGDGPRLEMLQKRKLKGQLYDPQYGAVAGHNRGTSISKRGCRQKGKEFFMQLESFFTVF